MCYYVNMLTIEDKNEVKEIADVTVDRAFSKLEKTLIKLSSDISYIKKNIAEMSNVNTGYQQKIETMWQFHEVHKRDMSVLTDVVEKWDDVKSRSKIYDRMARDYDRWKWLITGLLSITSLSTIISVTKIILEELAKK